MIENRQAEEELAKTKEEFERFFNLIPDMVVIASEDGYFKRVNSASERVLGYTAQELLSTPYESFIHPDDIAPTRKEVERHLRGGTTLRFENRYRHKDGSFRWLEWNATSAADGLLYAAARDITERKQAEQEKATLQAQLQQAQKMESVGRLAGGVAHDFNNMMGVVLGYADFALKQVDPAQPLHADLQEIRKAATRAADLTRQLLAFARKQTVEPKVLDLNDTVSGMLKMLHRLIGENIDLKWQPGAELWPVNVDPSQIDQILANLCVNARDAIAGVGTLVIETGNSTLDERYCVAHAGSVPGDYVRLVVSDNGCGMDQDTLPLVFEPFFTTKAMGEGAGLGLATVYGIVKQNSGYINVDSKPNHATTFTIYLPRHVGNADQAQTERAARPVAHDIETILLVEDEPAILELTERVLEEHGYIVLAASTPGAALRAATMHTGEIHLLMTDVVMPEMNGRALARNLQSVYPRIKCVFMSGYAADVIAHHGVLDEGVHFIQKPFSTEDLASKVREALDALD